MATVLVCAGPPVDPPSPSSTHSESARAAVATSAAGSSTALPHPGPEKNHADSSATIAAQPDNPRNRLSRTTFFIMPNTFKNPREVRREPPAATAADV